MFDCPELPLDEMKDCSMLDRKREDKHAIHKTSPKKFKDNPDKLGVFTNTNERTRPVDNAIMPRWVKVQRLSDFVTAKAAVMLVGGGRWDSHVQLHVCAIRLDSAKKLTAVLA
ncbi:hypothetical protein FCOIX_12804 [Fusarium coicis]|nr:hypothetical protein FCOIX_12804 [Fusarium coicis]